MSHTRKRWISTATALAVLLGSTASQPAYAWGKHGHRIISWIAEHRLHDQIAANHGATEADAKIAELLGLVAADPWLAAHPEYRYSMSEYHLADIASWADWLRAQDENLNVKRDGDNVTDHSVRLPIDGSPPNNPPCTGKDLNEPDHFPTHPKKCADQAITDFRAAIGDPGKSLIVRINSLKYVVHLVGDVHQLLHGSAPIGYNYVSLHTNWTDYGSFTPDPYYGQDPNNPNNWYTLHQVWDTAILWDYQHYTNKTDDKVFAEWMDNESLFPIPGSMHFDGEPRDWAEESRDWARDYIYTDAGYTAPPACWSTGSVPPGGTVCSYTQFPLTSDYTGRKASFVVFRLRQAGVRLACTLYHSFYPNEAYSCSA